jgi:hypothetical protein
MDRTKFVGIALLGLEPDHHWFLGALPRVERSRKALQLLDVGPKILAQFPPGARDGNVFGGVRGQVSAAELVRDPHLSGLLRLLNSPEQLLGTMLGFREADIPLLRVRLAGEISIR